MTDVRDLLDVKPRGPTVEITLKTVEFTVPFRIALDNRVPPCSAMTAREFRQYLLAKYAELVAEYRDKWVSTLLSQGGAS